MPTLVQLFALMEDGESAAFYRPSDPKRYQLYVVAGDRLLRGEDGLWKVERSYELPTDAHLVDLEADDWTCDGWKG